MPFRDALTVLEQSLAAFAELDYPDVELVLVDDASRDGGRELAVCFADRNENVTLIRLDENLGAAEARNRALRVVTGEYVWFVDCDDRWEPSILREMVARAIDTKADVVVCGAERVLPSGQVIGRCESIRRDRVVTSAEAVELLLEGRLRGYLWNKLIRRDQIPESPFPRITTQEDFCGLVPIIVGASKVALMEKPLYRYVVWPGSLTNSRDIDLANFDVQRECMVRVATGHYRNGRPLTTQAVRYDAGEWILLKAFTAARLKSRAEAKAEVASLRRTLTCSDALRLLPRYPAVGAKALALILMGARIVPFRAFCVALRDRLAGRGLGGSTSREHECVEAEGGSDPMERSAVTALEPAETAIGHERPAVFISTFPPQLNANYGGVLQAWAMERVLTDLGLRAYVNASRAGLESARGKKAMLVTAFGGLIRLLTRTRLGKVLPRGLREEAFAELTDAAVTRFAHERISLSPAPQRKGVRRAAAADFDAFVAGSDQVWRPLYGSVRFHLFDYLPANDSRPRFSYAASFGTDTVEFGSELRDIRALARRFTGISVRELSGVQLAEEIFGIRALQHVDPTMLIERDVYAALAAQTSEYSKGVGVVDYVLSRHEELDTTIRSVSDALAVGVTRIVPDRVSTHREYIAKGPECRKPSVEGWLQAISRAQCVVTDSFHGTVFSILNNVPFYVVVNRGGSPARFRSLLGTFGLEDRLIDPGRILTRQEVMQPIDWDPVNARLALERAQALSYLRGQLGSLLGHSAVASSARAHQPASGEV